MNLSSTGGGGRGSDKGDIIGDVILHGKKKYWLRGGLRAQPFLFRSQKLIMFFFI
jgi:hypothetical protein